MAKRHPVINSTYVDDYQWVCKNYLVIQTHNVDDWSSKAQYIIAQPFDLTSQPGLQLHLFNGEYLLILWHHISYDGWSDDVFIR